MLETKSKFTIILSTIIVVLTVIAAVGGICFPNVYQENADSSGNAFSKAYWYCNDLVTLIVAVPLLTLALILAQRGSLRARLVWLGVAHYTLYNYSFYLFGAALNWFSLLYVALFTLSIFVLVFVLANIDIDDISRNFRPTIPVKWISSYMFVLAALLVVGWSSQWISFVATGSLDAEHGNFIRTVGGVDISLLASGLVLGSIWLWKRWSWGYVVATILNISFTIYMLVLTMVSLTNAMVWVWVFLGIASLVASLILLGNLRPAK